MVHGAAGVLASGEDVVLDLRPHRKQLVLPFLVLLLVLAGTGLLLALVDSGTARLVVAGVSVVVLAVAVLPGYLAWRATRLVVTNRRLVVLSGTVRARRQDLPLSRVHSVVCTYGVLGRLLGYGTLLVDAGAQLRVEVRDLPRVAAVQSVIADLSRAGRPD